MVLEIEDVMRLMDKAKELGVRSFQLGPLVFTLTPSTPAPTPLPPELTQQQMTELDDELLFHSS